MWALYINRKENKDLPLREGTTTVHQSICSILQLHKWNLCLMSVKERNVEKWAYFTESKKSMNLESFVFFIKNTVYQVYVERGLS